MAIKNFNEILRKREDKANRANDGKVRLDDESRVKVLSPMQLIIKRFLRNKLAIVGLVILAAMFFFSFIGPFFSPYAESETFYVTDMKNLKYADASVRADFIAYNKAEELPLDVRLNLTTTANKLSASGAKLSLREDGGKLYLYELKDTGIESVSLASKTEGEAFSFASALPVATCTKMGKKVTVTYAEGAAEAGDIAFEKAMTDAVASKLDELVYGGVTYKIAYPDKISANVTMETALEDGLLFGTLPEGVNAEALRDAIATAAVQLVSTIPVAQGTQDNFQLPSVVTEYGGTLYNVQQVGKSRTSFDVYAIEEGELLTVATKYVVDGIVPNIPFVNVNVDDKAATDAAKAAVGTALFAFAEGKETFTLTEGGDAFGFARTEAGDIQIVKKGETDTAIAQMNNFVIRYYDGTDIVPYAVKQLISDKADEILEKRKDPASVDFNELSFSAPLPTTDADGKFVYDENGAYVTEDANITLVYENNAFVAKSDQEKWLLARYQPISGAHWLGTDNNGMDVLTRMMYGGRVSLMIGFVVVLIEMVLGVILGGIAGYFGGWVDSLIMRLVDVFNCIPSMPILIILGAMFDSLRLAPGMRLFWLMVILGVLGWSGVARLVRGQILSLREQEFMTATEATGIRVSRRIFRHLVPNVMPQLIVTATTGLGGVILTESTLSFLGLGVKHPMATWGSMINLATGDALQILNYAYIWIPVGVLICLTVVAFNFVGDGLRDAFDPKMKR